VLTGNTGLCTTAATTGGGSDFVPTPYITRKIRINDQLHTRRHRIAEEYQDKVGSVYTKTEFNYESS